LNTFVKYISIQLIAWSAATVSVLWLVYRLDQKIHSRLISRKQRKTL